VARTAAALDVPAATLWVRWRVHRSLAAAARVLRACFLLLCVKELLCTFRRRLKVGAGQRRTIAAVPDDATATKIKEAISKIKQNQDGGGLSGVESVSAAKEQQAAERARKYEQRQKSTERRAAADEHIVKLVEMASASTVSLF
jgi:hypothetical protein